MNLVLLKKRHVSSCTNRKALQMQLCLLVAGAVKLHRRAILKWVTVIWIQGRRGRTMIRTVLPQFWASRSLNHAELAARSFR